MPRTKLLANPVKLPDKPITYACFAALSVAIYFLCFYTKQNDFIRVVTFYGLSFIGYGVLVRQVLRGELGLALGIGIGCLIRVMLLFSFPNLSNDIYRFLWDGHLLHNSLSPLAFLPSDIIMSTSDSYLQRLFPLLNSPNYYTVYPPVSQVVYYISTWSDGWSYGFSCIIMKSILLIAELAGLLAIMKILGVLGKPKAFCLIYFLNPLLIVEVMGQLHFEGLMMAFLLMGLLAIFKNKPVLGGVLLACAVGTKLLPLMLMPALLLYLRSGRWYFLSAFTFMMALLFLPFFWSVDISHFFQSINLYFRSFEFNASLYFLAKGIGYGLTGYNQIGVIGPLLSIATVGYILYTSVRRPMDKPIDLLKVLFLSFACYLFLATTVHPWYLVMLLGLSVLLDQPWVWLWSGVVVLSYSTYAHPDFQQNYWMIGVEYLVVGLYLMCNFYKKERTIM